MSPFLLGTQRMETSLSRFVVCAFAVYACGSKQSVQHDAGELHDAARDTEGGNDSAWVGDAELTVDSAVVDAALADAADAPSPPEGVPILVAGGNVGGMTISCDGRETWVADTDLAREGRSDLFCDIDQLPRPG